VIPETILGDSRPAADAPPLPPGASAVAFGEHEHEPEDAPEVEAAPGPGAAVEPEPESAPPTRREAQRAAIDRVRAGVFALATWRERQPDGSFKVRTGVVLTSDEAEAERALQAAFDARPRRRAFPVSGVVVMGGNGLIRGMAYSTIRSTPRNIFHPDGTSIMADVVELRRAPEKPLKMRAAGHVRPDCAGIRSGADAERVLASHGIEAQLGSNLDDNPEFLQGFASATIDTHEKFPVLRHGDRRLRRIVASSTLAKDDPIRKGLRAESVAMCLYSYRGQEVLNHQIVLNDHTEHRKGQLVGVTESYAREGAYCPALQTAYGIAAHELGHAVAHAHWGKDATQTIHWKTYGAGLTTKTSREKVSEYAGRNADELFAESFAQKHTPGAGGWEVYDEATQSNLALFEKHLNDGQAAPII